MEALIDFAAVSGAIVFSLGVALSLEWFALNTLVKMMPVQEPAMVAEEVTSDKHTFLARRLCRTRLLAANARRNGAAAIAASHDNSARDPLAD